MHGGDQYYVLYCSLSSCTDLCLLSLRLASQCIIKLCFMLVCLQLLYSIALKRTSLGDTYIPTRTHNLVFMHHLITLHTPHRHCITTINNKFWIAPSESGLVLAYVGLLYALVQVSKNERERVCSPLMYVNICMCRGRFGCRGRCECRGR